MGTTVTALWADLDHSDTYELFFCGTPANEPSCVPFRPGEFDGTFHPTDQDGDGILDTVDNCPTLFNPLRPIDGPNQADVDQDGVGDICDL